ncbi:MAG: hypothetical protein V1681_11435 [Candidatus Neomarinimicrobiota bacterium]
MSRKHRKWQTIIGDIIRNISLMVIVFGLTVFMSCDQEFSDPNRYDFYYKEEIYDIPSNYKSPAKADDRACKILFLGNSLTYYNAQPYILQMLAAKGQKRVFIDQHCEPGAQMDYHRWSQLSRRKIKEQKWDFVILQEAIAEIASPESHELVLPFIEVLKSFIYANNPDTRILYFMPYANKNGYDYSFMHISYQDHQLNITVGTKIFAETADLMIAPLGQAWAYVRAGRPDIELYNADEAHPSYAGSYLGAAVYYAAIFQQAADTLNYSGMSDSVTTVYLRQVASRTVLDSLAVWRIPPLDNVEKWNITPYDDLLD